MKKVFIFAALALVSCYGGKSDSDNNLEMALEGYVVKQAGPMSDNIDYHLVGYVITDTLKASDRLSALRMEILENGNLWDDATRDSLLKIRDTEFPDDLLEGESLNVINRHRQAVDSLVAVWDKVSSYSFALNYEEAWFFATYMKANGCDIDEYDTPLKWMEDNRDKYDEAERICQLDPESTYGYRVEHDYTIFNPLLDKKVNIKNVVIFDKDMNFVSSENANTGEDIMRQITE